MFLKSAYGYEQINMFININVFNDRGYILPIPLIILAIIPRKKHMETCHLYIFL